MTPTAGWGGRRQFPRLRPRILRRSGAARGVPARYPAVGRRAAGAARGRSHTARVPDPAFRARSAGAAPLRCRATGSSTDRYTWTCSMARGRPATRDRLPVGARCAAGERDQHPGELRSSGGDEIEQLPLTHPPTASPRIGGEWPARSAARRNLVCPPVKSDATKSDISSETSYSW